MKRQYTTPCMTEEKFEANEYVACCGTSGAAYKFLCDAGYGHPGSLFIETNGQEGLQTGEGGDQLLASYYQACGTVELAGIDEEFDKGYYVPYGTNEVQNVKVWVRRVGLSRTPTYHATKEVNQATWEISKS